MKKMLIGCVFGLLSIGFSARAQTTNEEWIQYGANLYENTFNKLSSLDASHYVFTYKPSAEGNRIKAFEKIQSELDKRGYTMIVKSRTTEEVKFRLQRK